MFGYKIFRDSKLYDCTIHDNKYNEHIERSYNRVLRKYIPYDTYLKYGFDYIVTKVIIEWENELKRSLKPYYYNITYEFIVITYEIKFELILPMYK